MQSPKILFGGLLFLCTTGAVAQSVPTSLAPAEKGSTATVAKAPKKKSRFFAPKKKAATFKRGNVKLTARYEFYDRVEKAAKEKKRIMRILARPQYSDPSYFGHKKKPKKRPPHKMRFCDECHIRH